MPHSKVCSKDLENDLSLNPILKTFQNFVPIAQLSKYEVKIVGVYNFTEADLNRHCTVD